jgi:hypothetical protein
MSSELHEFLNFAVKLTKQDQDTSLYYYPENSLKKIRNDQMKIFVDECMKNGLIKKTDDGYCMTDEGKNAVANKEISKLTLPYKDALKRINKLYIDVLI